MTRPVRLYLSGQMRGLPDHGKTNIETMRLFLAPQGFDIFTPTAARLQALNLRSVFLVDLSIILSWADAVVLVRRGDWKVSRGAFAEIQTALAADIRVYQPTTERKTDEHTHFRQIMSWDSLGPMEHSVSQRLTPDLFEPMPSDHF